MKFSRTLFIVLAASAQMLRAQESRSDSTAIPPLTIGEAARLAARQNSAAEIARLRAAEASARVRQRQADLLPNLSSSIQQAGRTFNTATLGIDFPTAPGQKPLFDPRG